MVSECTLGKGLFEPLHHPGYPVSYSWDGYVLPPWLVEEIRRTATDAMRPLERAVLESVKADATPNYEVQALIDGKWVPAVDLQPGTGYTLRTRARYGVR